MKKTIIILLVIIIGLGASVGTRYLTKKEKVKSVGTKEQLLALIPPYVDGEPYTVLYASQEKINEWSSYNFPPTLCEELSFPSYPPKGEYCHQFLGVVTENEATCAKSIQMQAYSPFGNTCRELIQIKKEGLWPCYQHPKGLRAKSILECMHKTDCADILLTKQRDYCFTDSAQSSHNYELCKDIADPSQRGYCVRISSPGTMAPQEMCSRVTALGGTDSFCAELQQRNQR